jgi:hypothetical protein
MTSPEDGRPRLVLAHQGAESQQRGFPVPPRALTVIQSRSTPCLWCFASRHNAPGGYGTGHGEAQPILHDVALLNVLAPRANAAIAAGLFGRQSRFRLASNHTNPCIP